MHRRLWAAQAGSTAVMSGHRSTISDLPHALDSDELWYARLASRAPALFLDYDGVLTPIVDDPALGGAEGVTIERKRYAIAVHTRRAPDDATRQHVASVVEAVAARGDRLRVTGGRDIQEFRPDIDWDKDRALVRLTEVLALDVDRHPPVYVGDDLTDEDAFAVIVDDGVGVVVAGADDRPTAARLRLDHPRQTSQLLRLLPDLATKA